MASKKSNAEEFYGFDWIGEFVPEDIRDIAQRLRNLADSLDGKARLISEQMEAGERKHGQP